MSTTEVSILNEVLNRIAASEARLAELTSADTSEVDATATALAAFGVRLATLERTLAQTAGAADRAREQRLEQLALSYNDALRAVVDQVPNANIRTILRDQLGRPTGIVEIQPSSSSS